ncbi:MAG: response regulator [Massiliimalia sp.]
MKQMYTVMIVDDEYIVREDLRSLIVWEDFGFTVVAEAANGKTGIEMFHKYHPDIIFSDIRMPVLNGFEMIREIKNQAKECEFVLLTGYDDFEYARKAIDLNLHTYLLKHELSADMLLQVLEKTKNILENYRTHQNVVQGNLFREILTRRFREEEWEAFKADDNLEISSGCSCLLLIDCSCFDLEDQIQNICSSLSGISLYSLIDFDWHVAVMKVSKDGMKEYHQVIKKMMWELSGAMREKNQNIRMILSRKIHNLSQLPDIYDEAKTYEKYIPLISKSGGIIEVEAWESQPVSPDEMKKNLLEMKEHLEAGEYLQFEETALQFIRYCIRQKDPKVFYFWKERLVDELDRQNQLHHYGAEELVEQMTKAENTEETSNILTQIALRFDSMSAEAGTNKLRRILQYIDQNYQKDLSLKDIADLLYINEIYAGQWFKKEMGINFKKYLTQVRIEKAIELLQSGNYKIYEVSEMVGYQTLAYFSAKFKQVTGKNPSEFL